MKCGSDLRETLKSAQGDYLSITLITGKTYYGELKRVETDYLLLELKLRGGKGKTSVIIPQLHIVTITI
ncbi:MAG: hypothetical protein KKF16_07260 [Euryarchaeota archaeon]|nr:hypothetical protein [Euryarchaeota archaeon]MBU4608448.1 hypothetical protein [Euryarchaeota archaeon]MBV1729987.1 hypothetical protein [Methanobacterium sp.]MBV1755570.1 hypothetical protein [Methanobacterium sp.]